MRKINVLVLIEENASRRLPDQYIDAFLGNEDFNYYVVASCSKQADIKDSRLKHWKFVERAYRNGITKVLLELLFIKSKYRQAALDFKVQSFDCIFAFNHPILIKLALDLSKKYSSKSIFLINHLMSEELATSKTIIGRLKGLYGLFSLKRNLKKFDYGYFMTDSMRLYGVTKYLLNPERTSFWPSQVAKYCVSISPERVSLLKSFLSQETADQKLLNVVYSGNLSAARNLKDYFRHIDKLIDDSINLKIFILGYSDVISNSDDFFRIFNIKNHRQFIFMGKLAPNELDLVFSYMDAGLSHFDGGSPILIHNSPLKSREYLKAGLQVVASDMPDHRVLFGEDSDLLYKSFDEFTLIIKKLIYLKSVKKIGESRSRNIEIAITENYIYNPLESLCGSVDRDLLPRNQ